MVADRRRTSEARATAEQLRLGDRTRLADPRNYRAKRREQAAACGLKSRTSRGIRKSRRTRAHPGGIDRGSSRAQRLQRSALAPSGCDLHTALPGQPPPSVGPQTQTGQHSGGVTVSTGVLNAKVACRGSSTTASKRSRKHSCQRQQLRPYGHRRLRNGDILSLGVPSREEGAITGS